MKPYKCEGDFQMGRIRQHFVLEIVAKNEKDARNGVYADLGSRHGAQRRDVNIVSIKAIKPEEASAITQKKLA